MDSVSAMEALTAKLAEIDQKFDRLNEVVTPLMPLLKHVETVMSLDTRIAALEQACGTDLPKDLHDLRRDVAKFVNEVNSNVATKSELLSLQVPAAATSKPKDPKVATPDPFGGKRENCKLFISHLRLYFGAFPLTFAEDREKIRFALSYLTDAAQRYFLPFADKLDLPMDERPEQIRTFESFSKSLTSTFGIHNSDIWAETQLRTLRQTSSAVEYTAKFRTFMGMTAWNDAALCAQYVLGLKDSIVSKLAENERILEFERLVKRVHEIDGQQTAHAAQRGFSTRRFTFTQSPRTTEPSQDSASLNEPPPTTGATMDLSQAQSARISPQEYERRRKENACFYCGLPGHRKNDCPKRPKQRLNSLEDHAVEFVLEKHQA